MNALQVHDDSVQQPLGLVRCDVIRSLSRERRTSPILNWQPDVKCSHRHVFFFSLPFLCLRYKINQIHAVYFNYVPSYMLMTPVLFVHVVAVAFSP